MGPPIYIGGNWQTKIHYTSRLKLQWGHRFISVETAFAPKFRAPRHGASMGPPIYIGGNSQVTRSSGRRVRQSFNGATDLYRWKHNTRSVNVRVNDCASMGPPIYIGGNHRGVEHRHCCGHRFNGATDLYRWKHDGIRLNAGSQNCASMGSPIYIGGNS